LLDGPSRSDHLRTRSGTAPRALRNTPGDSRDGSHKTFRILLLETITAAGARPSFDPVPLSSPEDLDATLSRTPYSSAGREAERCQADTHAKAREVALTSIPRERAAFLDSRSSRVDQRGHLAQSARSEYLRWLSTRPSSACSSGRQGLDMCRARASGLRHGIGPSGLEKKRRRIAAGRHRNQPRLGP
jgi:hypothetical protein